MVGDDGRVVACVAVLALVATAGAPLADGPGGLAAAGHQPAGTNFTYTPLDPPDREPGAEDVRVGTIGQAADAVGTDFETLLEVRSVYEAGSWEGCGPTSSEVFGIDRDGDNRPYEVDETLTDNVKRFSAGEDVFVAEFYDEDDFGQSTHLNADDRVFSVIECPNNPAEPGWYQIDNASVTGRTPSGEVRTFSDPSHYFWICDCADEATARERLGPKPSAATPTPTATPTAATSTPEPTDFEPTATPGRAATATATPTAGATGGDGTTAPATPAGTATATGRASPTRAPDDWADYWTTPTVASGPGFGPLLAVGSLLAVGVLAHRRRR